MLLDEGREEMSARASAYLSLFHSVPSLAGAPHSFSFLSASPRGACDFLALSLFLTVRTKAKATGHTFTEGEMR